MHVEAIGNFWEIYLPQKGRHRQERVALVEILKRQLEKKKVPYKLTVELTFENMSFQTHC